MLVHAGKGGSSRRGESDNRVTNNRHYNYYTHYISYGLAHYKSRSSRTRAPKAKRASFLIIRKPALATCLVFFYRPRPFQRCPTVSARRFNDATREPIKSTRSLSEINGSVASRNAFHSACALMSCGRSAVGRRSSSFA